MAHWILCAALVSASWLGLIGKTIAPALRRSVWDSSSDIVFLLSPDVMVPTALACLLVGVLAGMNRARAVGLFAAWGVFMGLLIVYESSLQERRAEFVVRSYQDFAYFAGLHDGLSVATIVTLAAATIVPLFAAFYGSRALRGRNAEVSNAAGESAPA